MPSFLAALASGQVPAYLVHAVCSNAAPLYPNQPHGSAPRSAGTHHAAAARELIFDAHENLRVPRDLAVLQALCLLENQEQVSVFPWAPSLKYFGQLSVVFSQLRALIALTLRRFCSANSSGRFPGGRPSSGQVC
jgi:hypothetical protein